MTAADLRSVAKLGELVQALARFRATARAVIDEIAAEVRRQLAIIDQRHREATAEVRRCEVELHVASREEREAARADLEAAKERLRWVREVQHRALEAAQRYRAEVPRFEGIVEEHTPKACRALHATSRAAEAYLAVQPQSAFPSGATILPVAPSLKTDTGHTGAASESIANSVLPAGFAWVSMGRIDQSNFLARARVLATRGESDLRSAFEALKREILPALRSKPDVAPADVSRDDTYGVTGESDRSLKAYRTFFGDDAIELRGPDSEGRFVVARGWDRIRTAIDLDWPAIPARVHSYADAGSFHGTGRDLEMCRSLNELLTQPKWSAGRGIVDLWIGDTATAGGDEVRLRMSSQGESNLLIITGDHRQAVGLLSACFLSLASCLSPADAKFFVIDLAKGNVEWDEVRGHLVNLLPHSLEVYSSDDASRLLEKLAAEIERRISDRQDQGRWLGYLFVVDPAPDDVLSVGAGQTDDGHSGGLLKTIVLKGPTVGIHTLVWCDTAKIQQRQLRADQFRGFRYRLLGRPGSDQTAGLFLRSAMSCTEDPEAMVLDDRDQPQAPTMFYPYRTPAADWLENVMDGWRSRSNRDGK